MPFQGAQLSPRMVRYPIVRYPIKTSTTEFGMLSLQALRAMKSISAGPLRLLCAYYSNDDSLVITFWPSRRDSAGSIHHMMRSLQPKDAFKAEKCQKRSHHIKVARLQSEFCTKVFFRATNFLTKNAPKISPNFRGFVQWVRKIPEISLQISH